METMIKSIQIVGARTTAPKAPSHRAHATLSLAHATAGHWEIEVEGLDVLGDRFELRIEPTSQRQTEGAKALHICLTGNDTIEADDLEPLRRQIAGLFDGLDTWNALQETDKPSPREAFADRCAARRVVLEHAGLDPDQELAFRHLKVRQLPAGAVQVDWGNRTYELARVGDSDHDRMLHGDRRFAVLGHKTH